MGQKLISLKNDFGDVVRLKPEKFSFFAVWKNNHHINFWNKGSEGCAGDLRFGPDGFMENAEQVFLRLKGEGMDFIRLKGGTDPESGKHAPYLFFFRPETIEYFEDDKADPPLGHGPAITIRNAHFFLSEDERADFKRLLMQKTPADDWLEFSSDLQTQFRCARGHYAFRKSMITTMFADPEEGFLAIQTPDCYRSFVPMKTPERIIDAVARGLPQLVKSDAPAPACPLYYDPAVYPPGKRRHINIIFRL